MGIKRRKPSPALLVAIVALVAALAGTAIGGVAITALNKQEKKQVKKISKKQAKKLDKKIELTPGPTGESGPSGPSGSDANALQFVSGKDISGIGTTFLPVSGWIDGGEMTGPDARAAAPRAFTVRDFTVRLNAAVQFGNSRTFTFQRNGTKTAVACTVNFSEGGCTSGASVEIAAGDTVQIVSDVGGTPNPNGVFIGWRAANS
jgi:hypothetical protein